MDKPGGYYGGSNCIFVSFVSKIMIQNIFYMLSNRDKIVTKGSFGFDGTIWVQMVTCKQSRPHENK